MYFLYIWLHHAVRAQTDGVLWAKSPAPIFHYMAEVSYFKEYYIPVLCNACVHIIDFPSRGVPVWERDVGTFEEKQWKEALQAVQLLSQCGTTSVPVIQYIVLRVHLTPARLYKMGLRENSECISCCMDHGDLIHLLWCYFTSIGQELSRSIIGYFRLISRWSLSPVYWES